MPDTSSKMTPEDAALARSLEAELYRVAEDFGEYVRVTGPLSEAVAVSSDQLHERLHASLLFIARRLVARPRSLLLDDSVLLVDAVVTNDQRVLLSPTFSLPSNAQETLDAMRKITLKFGRLFATLSVVTGVQIFTGQRLVIATCVSDQATFRRFSLSPVRHDQTCDVSEWTVVEPPIDMSIVEAPPRVTPFGIRTAGSSLGN